MTTEQTPTARAFAEWLDLDARQAAHFTAAGEARLLDLEAQIAAEVPRTLADLYRKIVVADAGGDMSLTAQQIALAREARAALGLPPTDAPVGLSVPARAA